MEQHINTAKEWCALSSQYLNSLCTLYEPKINSRIINGERNKFREQVLTEGQDGDRNEDVKGETGHATVPDDSQADACIYAFWKWGTSALFDMRIVNLDSGSYLHQTSAKDLETAEKGGNYKYLHPCLKHRRSFTPIVYTVDGIPETEVVVAHQRLALLLSNKLK